MPFKIVRNDITKMQVDAIVNTANEEPIFSEGVDFAVYKAAGEEELLAARRKIGRMEEGEVAITPGFRLPAKYIIHAISACYIDGESGEERKLRACYRRSLRLAHENKCASIAFPLISTGSFGYPKAEGMRIALDEINTFLMKHEMLIYLVVFDTAATKLGLNLYPNLEAYIDHNYVCDKREEEYGDRYLGSIRKDDPRYNAYCQDRAELEQKLRPSRNRRELVKEIVIESCAAMPQMEKCAKLSIHDPDYDDLIERNEAALRERIRHAADNFQQYLFYLIQSKGMTNPEVYNRAYMDKKLFSKIKNNPNYHPDKATAMRLCIGAELNMDETTDLLLRAGYALSPSDKRDIVFSFFIENELFDMLELDIALEMFGLPCFLAS